jgi:hypothetical protein
MIMETDAGQGCVQPDGDSAVLLTARLLVLSGAQDSHVGSFGRH